MGLEMSNLDEHLWRGFMQEVFDLVTCYRQLQTQHPAPPPPPPTVPLPPVQPQPQQPQKAALERPSAAVTPIPAAAESVFAAWPLHQHQVPASGMAVLSPKLVGPQHQSPVQLP